MGPSGIDIGSVLAQRHYPSGMAARAFQVRRGSLRQPPICKTNVCRLGGLAGSTLPTQQNTLDI